MARMKFLCGADRCIDCNACVTACKNEHEVPWGINRRRSCSQQPPQVSHSSATPTVPPTRTRAP